MGAVAAEGDEQGAPRQELRSSCVRRKGMGNRGFPSMFDPKVTSRSDFKGSKQEVQRLHDVLVEAHDLEKHLSDMENQMERQRRTVPHPESDELLELKQRLVEKESVEGDAWAYSFSALKGSERVFKDLGHAAEAAVHGAPGATEGNSFLKSLLSEWQEQEAEHWKAQLTSLREASARPKEDEEAARERANAVAQAKELAEAHVRLHRSGEEVLRLQGELRRLEEVAQVAFRKSLKGGGEEVEPPRSYRRHISYKINIKRRVTDS